MSIAWPQRRIGDLCRLATGGTPAKTRPEYFGGEIRWLVSGDIHQKEIFDCGGRITELGMRSSNAKMLPTNSVMIALNGQGKTRGTVALLRTQATCNQSLVSISPIDPQTLLPEFLFANLHGRYEEIRQITGDSGNDRRGLNMDLIRNIKIPLAPAAEQQRIVRILDEASKTVALAKANAERNLQNARALFDSHLASIFAEHRDEWERVNLETLLQRGWVEDHMDGNHGGDYPRKDEFINDGVLYISAKCIENETIDISRAKYLSESRARQLRKGFARHRDVLFAHNATVGPVAILHTEEEKVILGTSLTYYRCNDKHILPEYLAHYMRSFGFTSQYQQVMQQSTRNQVPITKQREFFHIIPPLADQRKIARTLDGLLHIGLELSGIYERRLAALDALKKSLLHQAFTGQL